MYRGLPTSPRSTTHCVGYIRDLRQPRIRVDHSKIAPHARNQRTAEPTNVTECSDEHYCEKERNQKIDQGPKVDAESNASGDEPEQRCNVLVLPNPQGGKVIQDSLHNVEHGRLLFGVRHDYPR